MADDPGLRQVEDCGEALNMYQKQNTLLYNQALQIFEILITRYFIVYVNCLTRLAQMYKRHSHVFDSYIKHHTKLSNLPQARDSRFECGSLSAREHTERPIGNLGFFPRIDWKPSIAALVFQGKTWCMHAVFSARCHGATSANVGSSNMAHDDHWGSGGGDLRWCFSRC